MKADPAFSELLGALYEGPLEESPWQEFLARVREAVSADTVSMLLRPPRQDSQIELLCDGGSLADIQSYNEGQFVLDPFVNLEPGQVLSLHEVITTEALLNSDFYKLVMEPQGWYDFLGADIRFDDEVDARFRVGRYRESKEFGKAEKKLLKDLLPHLQRALRLHARLNRSEKERALYAGAVAQLAVATLILDESGQVLSCNPLAEQLLQQQDGLNVNGGQLMLENRDANSEWQKLLQGILHAPGGSRITVEALRVPRRSGRADLGLVVRSVPGSGTGDGSGMPSVAVFISDLEQSTEAPVDVITRLFGFTPTEATLAMLLARGLNLDEASAELGVSRNTTRTHLRALFAKTGVNRQSMLVRLLLKSVAPLA